MVEYGSRLSKLLPPSLGSLFGQPLDVIETRSTLPDPPRDLPGAHASPELCCIIDPYRRELMPRDAVAEVKLDGIRCLYIAGHLWTREGSPFEAAAHCLPILRAMEEGYGCPMFFDGEYVEEGGLESTIAAFRSRKGNGCLWLFDAVPFDQWKTGKPSREGLIDRKRKLRQVLLDTTERRNGVAVGYIEHVPIEARQVEPFARDLWSMGYEGMVVKAGHAPYYRKRTCDWMKVKLHSVSKMVVVDVLGCTRNGREEARALLVRLPSITVEPGRTRPASKPIKLTIPAGGLSETLWLRRGDLVDSTIEVEHAGFTAGGNPREAKLKSVQL